VILLPHLFSINDSIALIRSISKALREGNLSAQCGESLIRVCSWDFREFPLRGRLYQRFKEFAGSRIAIKIFFRVPLHRKHIMLSVCAFDGLNHSIIRALGCYLQTIAKLSGSLMMAGVNANVGGRLSQDCCQR
jgi:hypothetical protein